MDNTLGDALSGFERAIKHFRDALAPTPEIEREVFRGSEDWADLLTYKLVPHLSGEGCLVAAVSGGTNTGKSTVFNLLLDEALSPVVTTAAATCHPILAANETRCRQCLEAKLVPEFSPVLLDDPENATDPDIPPETLFVVRADSLPNHLVLMDTPDVDSIDTSNWEIADHIRAAGDVLVAVVTAEKYKDERVIDFFREAKASGRVIVPLMNKANPAKDFEVARKQLDEFCKDVGIEQPRFVVEHNFEVARDLERKIASLDNGADLRAHLESMPVSEIKERVFRGTVDHFIEQAEGFVAHVADAGSALQRVIVDFENDARAFSERYEPAPGKEVGGLFHDFVQERRGPIRRYIGLASGAVVRGVSVVGRRVSEAFRKRAVLDVDEDVTDDALNKQHRQAIERITKDLATKCIESARRLPVPVGNLLAESAAALQVDDIASKVAEDTLKSENISEEFRAHAMRTLETWWEDHRGKRRALEALDAMLAVLPAAIAAPIAMHTGGIGASEAAIVVAPVAEQFVARVIEYQFGDAMFDFLSPWRREQQETLEKALRAHLTDPLVAPVRRALKPFESKAAAELGRCLEQCRKA